MSDRQLVAACRGCLLAKVTCTEPLEGECTAFDDPEYQHLSGACWGRCDNADETVRRLSEIVAYADKHGVQAIAQRRELREWQQVAEAMRGEDTNG